MSVGAIGRDGDGFAVGAFSNRGPTISAPGVGITSAKLGGGLAQKTGTSMACPHFHARYAGQQASVAIATLETLAGSLPERALRLVREWAALHQGELEENWLRARDEAPLEPIAPLP